MASAANGTSNNKPSKFIPNSLTDVLTSALPSGFNCNIRYVHSAPKPCDPLFSALPGQQPEKTRLASHFLTVNVDPTSLSHLADGARQEIGTDVFGFAVEALVYTSRRLTTIFVSKVDSTPFLPRIRPSPIKAAITAFLQWLADEERQRRPTRKTVISLFARAQAQYLFPGSSDDKTKHVLDDRQLIKWWARVLDPILPKVDDAASDEKPSVQYQGYLTVPGYASNELRSFMPSSAANAGIKPHWLPGNPLLELAQTRGLPEHAPPRCLLPRFPDDPKARFMLDLDDEIGISQDSQVHISPSKRKSGRWNSVQDLDRFWEAMEFRQECSSGRVVGFLWVVISPTASDGEDSRVQSFNSQTTDSQDSSMSLNAPPASDHILPPRPVQPSNTSPKKRTRRPLTGPIIPRQPRLKGGSSSVSNLSEMQSQLDNASREGIIVTREGYDKAMQTLLNLDFSTLQIAVRSTSKWVAELAKSAALSGDFAVSISGTAKVEAPPALAATNGTAAVNDLGGMIRKKRKPVDEPGSRGHAVAEAGQGLTGGEQPAVNMLGAGTIRKKPKPSG